MYFREIVPIVMCHIKVQERIWAVFMTYDPAELCAIPYKGII